MARIPGAEPAKAGLIGRMIYWAVKRKIGRVVEPIRITAHHPALLRALAHMEQAQAGADTVPGPLKALASLKVATMIGCPF